MKRYALIAYLLLIPFISCDDGDSSPQAQCEMLLDSLCDRIEQCGVQLTGETSVPATFHQQCLDTQNAYVNCENVVSVSSSYDACLADVDTYACNSLITIDATVQQTIDNLQQLLNEVSGLVEGSSNTVTVPIRINAPSSCLAVFR